MVGGGWTTPGAPSSAAAATCCDWCRGPKVNEGPRRAGALSAKNMSHVLGTPGSKKGPDCRMREDVIRSRERGQASSAGPGVSYGPSAAPLEQQGHALAMPAMTRVMAMAGDECSEAWLASFCATCNHCGSYRLVSYAVQKMASLGVKPGV